MICSLAGATRERGMSAGIKVQRWENAALITMRDLRTSFRCALRLKLRPVRPRRALSQHIVTDFRASRHLKWGHRAQVLHASKINQAKDLPVAQLSRVRKSTRRFRTKTAEKGICRPHTLSAPQTTRDVDHKRQ